MLLMPIHTGLNTCWYFNLENGIYTKSIKQQGIDLKHNIEDIGKYVV